MKYHFNADKYAQACMVLPLNGFGSINLRLIYSWLLSFANGACMGVVAGMVVYMGMEKSSIDGPAYCSAIFAFFLLSFGK